MNSGLKTGAGVALPLLAPYIANPTFQHAAMLLIACIGGAYASFAWGDPVEPRGKMARLFVSCVIMGIAFTVVTNAVIEHFTDMSLKLGSRAAIGAIIASLVRFIMPKVIDAIKDGTWKELIPFVRKKQ